jgi:hypothetical protein
VPQTTKTLADNADQAAPRSGLVRRPLQQASLRSRVAIGVALPLLITLAGFSLVNYLRERRLL